MDCFCWSCSTTQLSYYILRGLWYQPPAAPPVSSPFQLPFFLSPSLLFLLILYLLLRPLVYLFLLHCAPHHLPLPIFLLLLLLCRVLFLLMMYLCKRSNKS